MNLKEYQNKYLKNFITIQILTILLFSNNKITSLSMVNIKGIFQLLHDSILYSLIYCYIAILDEIITTNCKNTLLYGKIKKMPGFHIFSYIKNCQKMIDYRINNQAIKTYYKKIHISVNQNVFWYEIYQNVKDREVIISFNKRYLLLRDIYISNILIFISYILFCCLRINYFNYYLAVYLIVNLIISFFAARNASFRFVKEVSIINFLEKGVDNN